MTGKQGMASMSDIIRAAAKAGEPDRYLAALLAPPAVRDDLVVLAAFTAEINRIPLIAREPQLAEIRLQWWLDNLLVSPWRATGHPIADAFADVLMRRSISKDLVENWLNTLAHTFYPEPPKDEALLDLELDSIEGSPFLFAALICGEPMREQLCLQTRHAGIAYGMARLGLYGAAQSLARGRVPLPLRLETGFSEGAGAVSTCLKTYVSSKTRAALTLAKDDFRRGSRALRTALLPVAMVEPYLRALEMPSHDAAHDVGEVAPLVRVIRIAWAGFRGRL